MKVSSQNQSLVSEPGTIHHVVQQLVLWGETVREGLTRVEGEDARTQISALISLRQALRRQSLPVTQVPLPQASSPITRICNLMDELQRLSPGLLIIKWPDHQFTDQSGELVEALRFFAYEYDKRRMGRHRQIWWLNKPVSRLIQQKVPELDRKFTHHLQVTERSWHVSSGTRQITRRFANNSTRGLEDVRLVRSVTSFLYRRGFNWALSARRPVREILLDIIAPGVKCLLDVGLEADARNFSNSCLTALSLRENERYQRSASGMDGGEWALASDPETGTLEADDPDRALFLERDAEEEMPQEWMPSSPFAEAFARIDEMDPAEVVRTASELTQQGQNAQICRRWEDAENLLMQAFGFNARKFGWGSPNTLLSLRDLALLTEDRGEDQYEPWMEHL
jgi:hypothetical protein